MNPDPFKSAAQETLIRLTEAGWIQKSCLRDDEVHVVFTPLGLIRMAALAQLLKEIGLPPSQAHWACLFGLTEMASEQPDIPPGSAPASSG